MKNSDIEKVDMKFGLILGETNASVFYKGKNYTFLKDSKDFNKVLDCVRKNDFDSFEKLFVVNPGAHLKSLSDGVLDWRDGEVWLGTENGDKKLPANLYKALLEFKELNQPYDRLVKFAQRLLQNPRQDSIDQFYSFCRKHLLTIFDDGCFLAYKKVNDDYTDVHSGKFDNSPGKSPKMPREDVDDDRNSLCSRGLHVCAWEYLSSFGGKRIMAVKVDPKNVVSVPRDHNDAKIRTCEYLVLNEVMSPLSGVATDIDKKVTVDRLSSDEKTVVSILHEYELEPANVFFYKEDDMFSIFHVHDNGNEEWVDSELDSYVCYLNKKLFIDGIRLLKNKKSGYYEPLLRLKQAYRKGLVKQLNVDEGLSACILQLG